MLEYVILKDSKLFATCELRHTAIQLFELNKSLFRDSEIVLLQKILE